MANQPGATAFGAGARATGDPTTAIGFMALASGQHGTAIGGNAEATGDLSTALGQGAIASGTGSTALGQGAQASQANTVALGQGVQTTRAGQVAIGGEASTYTLAGLNSAASRAAQSGTTRAVTADASGNLATLDLQPFFDRVDGLSDRAGLLEARTDGIEGRLRRYDEEWQVQTDGVAMAMALSGAQLLPPDADFALGAGYGVFESQGAMAVSAVGRVSRNVYLNFGVAYGASTQSVASRGGIVIGW